MTAGFCGSSAEAQIFTWTNAAGGTFNVAGNWSPAGPPTVNTHTALFNLNSTYGVTLTAPATSGTLSMSAGSVTMTANASSGTYTVDRIVLSGGSLNLGSNIRLTPALSTTISTGATLNIGTSALLSTSGSITVNGGTLIRSSPFSSSTFSLGTAGQLNVQGGGTVSLAYNFDVGFSLNSNQVVNVTNGLFTVTNGGGINVGDAFFIANGANARVLNNTGASFWGGSGTQANISFSNGSAGTFAALLMGNSGSSSLSINNSAVSSSRITMGDLNGGSAAIELAGATATYALNTGTVTSSIGSADPNLTTTVGTILISGGTFTNTGTTLFVRRSGLIDIRTAGALEAQGPIDVTGTLSTAGRLNLAAGNTITLQNHGRLSLTGGTLSGGTVLINTGAVFSQTGGAIAPSTKINLNGGTIEAINNTTELIYNGGAVGTLNNSASITLSASPMTVGALTNLAGGSVNLTAGRGIAAQQFTLTGGVGSISGGSLNASNLLVSGGSLVLSSGTLISTLPTVAGGTFIFNGGRIVTGAFNLTGGTFSSNGSAGLDANFNQNGGTVVGTLNTNGNLNLSAGTLLGTANAAGPVFITGTITGTGSLNVNNTALIDGGSFGAARLNVNAGAIMSGGGTISAVVEVFGMLAPSGSLTLSGLSTNRGLMVVEAPSVVRPTGSLANFGMIQLAGGAFTSGDVSNFPGGGSIRGFGAINSQLSNNSLLIAEGGLLAIGSLTGNQISGIIQVRDDASMNIANAFSSDGAIDLFGPGAQLSGATITISSFGMLRGAGIVRNTAVVNNGLVSPGDGLLTFTNPLSNNAAGVIEIPTGARLRTNTGFASQLGQIILGGGTLDNANHPLTNAGVIAGRGAIRSGLLTNTGTITLSGGTSDIFPSLTQNSVGKTIVTGFGTTTFYGNVSNNAGSELRVSTGSTAIFLGNVGGLSLITGGGVKVFEGSASGGPLVTAGRSTVAPGASLAVDGIRESSLEVNGVASIDGSVVSRLTQLTLAGAPNAWTGRLGLTDDRLIIDYVGASPLGTIANQIKQGYNAGAWNGAGISSSTAAVTPGRGIGFAEASALGSPIMFFSEPIDATTLLLRYTLQGDADLSGSVNLDDFTRLAAGFGSGTVWTQGDFTYDGLVNLDDFTALAANFGQPLPADAARASVPEPGSCAGVLGAVTIASLFSRGRRATGAAAGLRARRPIPMRG